MMNPNTELSVLQAVAQFFLYAVVAVFAENAVLFRALGVSRLIKLVNDPEVRRRVVEDISAFGTQTLGLELLGVEESPIRGREKGNIEYLAWWRKPAENAIIPPPK